MRPMDEMLSQCACCRIDRISSFPISIGMSVRENDVVSHERGCRFRRYCHRPCSPLKLSVATTTEPLEKKSLNFLISRMAAFSLSFDAPRRRRRTILQRLQQQQQQQFFTVHRAASLLMSTDVYPITESEAVLSATVVVEFQSLHINGGRSLFSSNCCWRAADESEAV